MKHAVIYVGSFCVLIAAIPMSFLARRIRYQSLLKKQTNNPNIHFLNFLNAIEDEEDQKRFKALYLPAVAISTNNTRSELLGEGYYGRVVKAKINGKQYCVKVSITLTPSSKLKYYFRKVEEASINRVNNPSLNRRSF